MRWWNVLKMSDKIKWIVDQLDDNGIVELSGMNNANEVEIVLEIPINPRFIEWMNKQYKIEFVESWRVRTRHKYQIEVIGE